ncbi:HAD-superfamily hydrolase [Sunxiuqinia dokdonensis]|uniref:HAD-superfamily hydrolase n=2 Tax=Sunxiuqinia dokdonensis TaxID=1409788 RepID=A0A0L8V3Y1_9BACT|nr:HAD-superfamily hydrolase [Sunxiuqinia dokdonensis]
MEQMTKKSAMKAVIFDMDGVIIDSCNLWKQAEYEVFSSVGVKLSDELCKITESMTTSEVSRFWFDRNPWQGKSLAEIEKAVIKRVACLVEEEGKAIDGIEELIKNLKLNGYKIGLATNSPSALIPVVLEKLKLKHYFDAVSSAEHELEGKPDPSVYRSVIRKLGMKPGSCIAVEDSLTGLQAAKKAGKKTVALVKDHADFRDQAIIDCTITCYKKLDFSLLG